MTINKIKILLLVIFGLFGLFIQNSFADTCTTQTIPGTAYCQSSGHSCGALNSSGQMQLSILPSNEICSFDSLGLNTTMNQFGSINISKITVPYAIASDVYHSMNYDYNKQFLSYDEQASKGLNPSWLKTDFGWQNISDECDTDRDFNTGASYWVNGQYRALIENKNLAKYFVVPEIYKNVRSQIIYSCLPGSITVTNPLVIGQAVCKHRHDGDNQSRYLTYNNTAAYTNWSYAGCGPLLDNISIKTNIDPANDGGKDPARAEVAVGGTFTLKWSSSNPSATCKITGKNADNPSAAFSESIGISDYKIFNLENALTNDDSNVYLEWKDTSTGISPTKGSYTFINAKYGIYTYTLSCTGVLNGKYSPDIGTRSKTVTVFVGNIPNSPTANISFVPSPDLQVATNTPNTAIVSIGKSVQLHWEASNINQDSATSSISIYYLFNGIKTPLIQKNDASGDMGFNPSRTGFYSISIEAINPDVPELGTAKSSLVLDVRPLSATRNVDVQFSATKTSITKGENSTLTWNAVDYNGGNPKSVTITPNIGDVSANGTLDVSPTITTSYTLTAVSNFTDVAATRKIVTIQVGGATSTLAESITNEADCVANNYYWYDNSCHDSPQIVAPPEETFTGQATTSAELVTDLKANGSDGPVTLQAPATFKLSWNINSYCLATGSWLDVKFKAGTQSMTVNKNGKYTYSLYCPGYGSDSVEVDVVGGTGANANTGLLDSLSGKNTDGLSNTPMPVAEATISTDKLNYSQNVTVIKGQPTDIYIRADQSTSGDGLVSRDETGQWSDLMSNGGRCLYNTKLIKGTPQFDGMIESPVSVQSCNAKLGSFVFNDQPGTYQYGILKLMQNNNKFSNIAYVNITVENPPPQTGAPVIDLRINNNDSAEQILATPAKYSLSWNVTNADTCEASGSWSGTRDLQGTHSFVSSAAKNFTYTLDCIGQLGTTTKSIALEVMESPACQFTALPPTISKQSAFVTQSELSWNCNYADECSMLPDVGTPIKTYGSVRVSPDSTTTYELTCLNSATSTKFDATVGVQ